MRFAYNYNRVTARTKSAHSNKSIALGSPARLSTKPPTPYYAAKFTVPIEQLAQMLCTFRYEGGFIVLRISLPA